MMINQSYVTYKQMQDTSGTRLKTISSQPFKLNRTQENRRIFGLMLVLFHQMS